MLQVRHVNEPNVKRRTR